MKTSILKNSLLTLLSIFIFVVVWKLASISMGTEIIFPSPEATFFSFIEIIKSADFFPTVFSTLGRVLLAFMIAVCAGVVVGLIIGFNRTTDILFKPVLSIIMTTPVISFILLALIWFKTEQIPIFATFLMTFPIITINVSEGIKGIDKNIIDMAYAYKVNKIRILREIYLPSIMSFLVAGISTAVGIGWKVTVTAEVLSQPQFGIGTQLDTAKMYIETSAVFAWTFVAIFLGFICEKIIRMAEARFFSWR